MGISLLDANDRPGEHAPSWYAATANPIGEFAPVAGHRNFDVAIVGAGFSGLSAALHLSERGMKVCVVDAHRVGWGASGRNGGQVGTGQRVDQEALEKLVGETNAHKAFQLGYEATDLVRSLINKCKIDCSYRSGTIEANHRKRYDQESERYVEFLRENYNYDHISYLSPEEMWTKVGSDDYSGGSLDTYTGHLHPLNFVRGLAAAAVRNEVEIFEMSRVLSIQGSKLVLENGEISADQIILAANGYLGSLDKTVADRVMPINNFMLATEPLDEALCRDLIRDGECVHDSRFVVNYFRISEDRRLLFGGGENYTYKFPKDIVKTVRKPMLEVFPNLSDTKIDYAWGGTLAITVNRVPHFEYRNNNLLNISGYSGSGIHMATMAGKLAAEAISGQMERFDVIAKLPTPGFPGGARLRWPLLPLALTWYAMRDKF